MKKRINRIFLIIAVAILAIAMSAFVTACSFKDIFNPGDNNSDNTTTVPDPDNTDPENPDNPDNPDPDDPDPDDPDPDDPDPDDPDPDDPDPDNPDPDNPDPDDPDPDDPDPDNPDPDNPDPDDPDPDNPDPDDPDPDDPDPDHPDPDNPDPDDPDPDNPDPDDPDPDDPDPDDPDPDEPEYNGELVSGELSEVADAKFSIHFLEVGNQYTGDCTLIKCGNTEILIDAGSRYGSATTLKKYIDQYCTDGVLEYVIATHAHQDHIAGFVGNASGSTRTGILYQYKVGTLIQFGGTNATTATYRNYLTAVEYAKGRGTTVYTATQCWYQTDGAKRQYFLDEAQTLSMNILYNYYYDHSTSDENDYSVCMLLTNVMGDKSYNYLFTGDLEEKGESYLVDNNTLPEVELYKGGHHGSYTASTEKLLKAIKPKAIAICCCAGSTEYTTNNNRTFPAQDFINRVAKYTDKIYVTTVVDVSSGKEEGTSMNGNIVFYFTDKWKLYCSNNDTILKETDWFKSNRTWPADGV